MLNRSEEPVGEGPKYIIYDPTDGRILGTYRKYDANQEQCVECNVDEIIEEVAGSSAELVSGNYSVLQVTSTEGQEFRGLKVDTNSGKLMPRDSRRSTAK